MLRVHPFRHLVAVMAALLITTALLSVVAAQALGPWAPVAGHIMTRFAGDVSPDRAWPDYPRPQMVRSDWQSLNGLWQYAITPKEASAPAAFDGRILVPYPIESALSGVGRTVSPAERVWYQRTFAVPDSWKDRRVWLRFDAVDWSCVVSVNGKEVGRHTGGYDRFGFDITDTLIGMGPHTVTVSAWDPSDDGEQPRGKQVRKPHGIWYTPSTGIWQSVWLEPQAPAAIDRLHIVSDATGSVRVTADVTASAPTQRLRLIAKADGREVARAEAAAPNPVALKIPTPRLWSPASPFLYDLDVSLLDGTRVVDTVTSYTGLRSITVGHLPNGAARLLLNGEPLFQYGFLDQGFWPDGLHTPPTDAAMRFDIEATRAFGMNLARKHIKIEPDRWYYWADRLGLLVWQDMPSGKNTTPEARANFLDEWRRIIPQRWNHPSIVMWVPYNEEWGQPSDTETRAVVGATSTLDPTRPVNATSGWRDVAAGSVWDIHQYPGPAMPALDRTRPAILGEFGGLGLPVRGHTWQDEQNWGYVTHPDAATLERVYREKIAALRILVARGLSAAVYTQTTDVEIEVNGLMTYDRATEKIPRATLQAIHKTLYDALPTVTDILPPSDLAPRTWRSTTQAPVGDWRAPSFDDTTWTAATAPFQGTAVEGLRAGSSWTTPDIWLRQSFTLRALPTGSIYLLLAHDDSATVYINGVEAAAVTGYVAGYTVIPVADAARRALKVGTNVIAITCHQDRGAQAVDAGLIEVR